MRLAQTTESVVSAQSQQWLGSAHGTDTGDSITLDVAAFTALAAWDDGEVMPSGVGVSRRDVDGLYVPFNAGAGHSRHRITLEDVVLEGTRQTTAGLWHGQVVSANLPADSGIPGNEASFKLVEFV
jgi:hypothetical protein